jgi:hypothetical protein
MFANYIKLKNYTDYKVNSSIWNDLVDAGILQ